MLQEKRDKGEKWKSRTLRMGVFDQVDSRFRANHAILRSAPGSLPDQLESELNLP
jgi:hypothetical protein